MIIFSLWIEQKEAQDAILGVVGSGAELSPQEKNHLLARSTKDFGSEIIKKIKGLGVVKNTNDNKGRYGDMVRLIDNGIKISDLIKMVSQT